MMWLLVFVCQIQAETTNVDTTKPLPFLLQDLSSWFDRFTPLYRPKLACDGSFKDLAQPVERLGCAVEERGLIGRSRTPFTGGFERPIAMLDGQSLKDPVTGSTDLDQLPVDVLSAISPGEPQMGSPPNPAALSLVTRKNVTNVPASQLRFATGNYGAAKLGLDYSRHLSRRVGCFASFNQLDNLSDRALSTTHHSSLLGSLYGDLGLPMSVDFYTASNSRTLPDDYWQEKRLYAGSVSEGDSNLALTASYRQNDYRLFGQGPVSDTLRHRLHSVALSASSGLTVGRAALSLGGSSAYHTLTSNYLAEDDWFGTILWSTIGLRSGPLTIEPSVCLDLFDLGDAQVMPYCRFFYRAFDSAVIRADLGRAVYRPGYQDRALEPESLGITLVRGNSRLGPERFSKAAVGMTHLWLDAEFYFKRVDDRIIDVLDNDGWIHPVNAAAVDYFGFDGFTSVEPLPGLHLQYGGNYCFQDSLTHSYLSVVYQHDFTNVSLGAGYEKVFVTEHVHNAEFRLRFIDCHLRLKFENLLDRRAANVRPRSALFSVFWNFWN